MWGEKDRTAILPKTKESGIMVSDFVEEGGARGFLKLTDAEFETARESNPDLIQSVRQFLEYGAEKEGYWTGDRFMKQIENAANTVDIKYDKDNYTVVWLFDQSSCHRKFDEKARKTSWSKCWRMTLVRLYHWKRLELSYNYK